MFINWTISAETLNSADRLISMTKQQILRLDSEFRGQRETVVPSYMVVSYTSYQW